MKDETMQQKKKLTIEEVEKRVLASLIDPNTARAANVVMQREKLDPEMLTTNVRDLYRSLALYGAHTFGGMVGDEAAAELSTARPDILASYARRIVANYKKHLREIDRTLDEFSAPERDEDDEDCLFRNRWLRRGACGMLISTSGVGKSSFTMQAAAHWAAGVPMLGIPPMKPLKVGIVQSEDDEYDVANFRDKIRIGLRTELKWTNDQIAEAEQRVTFCAWDGSTGENFVEFVRRKQQKHHFDLILVNPLHAFFGGDIKNADEVSKFLRNGIDRLIKDEDTKCAIIFVHHTGKPSKEKLAEGDFFAGYMGSGSAELINYPRIALTITPYKDGRVPGVFNLIGSKHGDKLKWRDDMGKLTTKKVVCYANRLARHKDDGVIYWLEPDEDELAEIENAGNVNRDGIILQAAYAIAAIFKAKRVNGPKTWAEGKECRQTVHFPKSTCKAAVNLIGCDPLRFGLKFVDEGRGKSNYYAADNATEGTTDIEPTEVNF